MLIQSVSTVIIHYLPRILFTQIHYTLNRKFRLIKEALTQTLYIKT